MHEGGWTISAVADGAFVFNSPVGKRFALEPPREGVEEAPGWLREWAEDSGLDLGPDVSLPQWDGKKPDYGLAVELLAAG